jgi:DNA topoisomerase-2
VNAADNYQRDRKTSRIEIKLSGKDISVCNDGKAIPVQMHRTEKMWVPQLIFGHLLTSSNYEDTEKKVTGGRNGYGAKLANIFSQEFTAEVGDSGNRKLIRITWRKNMKEMDEPIVESY